MACKLAAVHAGQADIGNQQVERLSCGKCMDRLLRIADSDDLMPAVSENIFGEFADGRIVFDEQDALCGRQSHRAWILNAGRG